MIAIDGASLDLITSATAEGRLPNFGRILDAGAVRHLATLHPTSAEAVWAAVATGKLPQKNGVRSSAIYQLAGGGGAVQLLPDYCFAHGLERFGFLVEQAHTSATFRTRTLWSILSTDGFTVGVVGWPLTQPAPVVRGYRRRRHVSSRRADAVGHRRSVGDLSARTAGSTRSRAMETRHGDAAGGDRVDGRRATRRHRRAIRGEAPARTDRVYDRDRAGDGARAAGAGDADAYQSLDPIGHYFLRYALPSEFGDVTDDERRRLGTVLERHYGVDRRGDRPGDGGARAGGSADRRVGLTGWSRSASASG